MWHGSIWMSPAISRFKLIGEAWNGFYDLEIGLKQPFLTLRERIGSCFMSLDENDSPKFRKNAKKRLRIKWPEVPRNPELRPELRLNMNPSQGDLHKILSNLAFCWDFKQAVGTKPDPSIANSAVFDSSHIHSNMIEGQNKDVIGGGEIHKCLLLAEMPGRFA